MIRNILLAASIFASAQLPSYAQSNLRKEDLCPDYSEIDPLLECTSVDSYAGLAEVIENAPSGSEITLCPFFLRKVTSVEPITVKTGVRVKCARTAPDQFCTVIGLGNHLIIDTAEDTMFQGFSFRGSNDHAVLVSGEVENAELATHTFCQLSFLENTRTEDTRGGALMLEKSAGTVNVVECFFQENFSKTFGAAIYSRAGQLNILYSMFVKNKANGYGGALYTASGGGLMIQSTTFLGNRGRDDHDVVFNPGTNGASIYEDGFENSVNDGDCRGVFNLVTESCIVFEKLPPTLFPTQVPTSRPTEVPTSRPTVVVTKSPTAKPSQRPTIKKITVPTSEPSLRPTIKTTSSPTVRPTESPTARPTIAPTQVATTTPTMVPTRVATAEPSQKPIVTTVKPTGPPTTTDGIFGTIVSNKCSFRAFPEGSECLDVQSFEDFKAAIESASNDVTFCGGFKFRKTEVEPVHISSDIDIRCQGQCSFHGVGPFLNIGGVSKIRLQNLKFANSRESSAVIVSTVTAAAQTTFCDTEFARNQVSVGNTDLGGAITIQKQSGVVNLVNNTFTGNIAQNGGAIQSNGFKLNIVGSRFVANNAFKSGNAIFVSDGHHLSVQSSTFILNTEKFTRSSGRGESSSKSAAIVVQPNKSIRSSSHTGSFVDGGSNKMILSGDCNGFYVRSRDTCDAFE